MRLFVVVLLSAAAIIPSYAQACSCAPYLGRDQFVGGSYSVRFDVPARALPPNSKGVLYETSDGGFDMRTKSVPQPEEFEMKDLDTDEIVRKFEVRELKPFENDVVRSTLLEDSTRLFRIEPDSGFKAGHRYLVSRRFGDWQTFVMVKIGDKPLEPRELSASISVTPSTLRIVGVPGGAGCSSAAAGMVSSVRIEPSRVADAYSRTMEGMFLGRTTGSGAARLHFAASMCDQSRRSYGGNLTEEVVDLCSEQGVRPANRMEVRGWYGLLELEDRLRSTDAVFVEHLGVGANECRTFLSTTKERDAF